MACISKVRTVFPVLCKIQIQRQIQPSRSVTVQANETYCSACREAQEYRGRAEAANLAKLCFIPTCFLLVGLCVSTSGTHSSAEGFAGSGQWRQIKVDPREGDSSLTFSILENE